MTCGCPDERDRSGQEPAPRPGAGAVLTARDPQALAGERYDLVIIGGGIYGIMVALEAARRRLRPILIERDDFAAATSANSLGIIHGGLRYLQGLDLSRFRASVAERRWFLRHFPDSARPTQASDGIAWSSTPFAEVPSCAPPGGLASSNRRINFRSPR